MSAADLNSISFLKIRNSYTDFAANPGSVFMKILSCMIVFSMLVACGESQQRDDVLSEPQHLMQNSPALEMESRGTLDEAQQMLERAIAHYKEVGREQALRDFTEKKEPFIDRDLYVFCYGADRTIVGHGADPELIGVVVDDLRDVDDFAFGTRIMEAALESPDGGLVEYKWYNPVTAEVEPKVSIVKQAGDDVCGVGAYASQ